jgi:hypothetical protein
LLFFILWVNNYIELIVLAQRSNANAIVIAMSAEYTMGKKDAFIVVKGVRSLMKMKINI